jgi:hypothetical protein
MAIDKETKTGSVGFSDLPLSSITNIGKSTAKEDISASSNLPDSISAAVDEETGKTYYADHTTQSTSWVHPRDDQIGEPFTAGLPYPYERKTDKKGRCYYLNHKTGASSWLNPVKLEELKSTGILDKEMDQLVSDGKAGEDWPWIVKEVIGSGLQKGEEYWVNYRQFPDGCANNRSPEDTKAGYLASAEARAARERREAAERDANL